MDGSSFDRFTRQFAHQGSRRWFLTRLGLFGGAVAGGAVLDEASAARRPTPAPRPISCPGRQFWEGSACACEDGFTICGPDCCPDGQAECCDNACCYGSCWGEELCCPTGRIVCEDACRDWAGCTNIDCGEGRICDQETHTCECYPACDGTRCFDGCGVACCPEGQSQCCGESCCTGSCFNGEFCCTAGDIYCQGACRDWECCTSDECPQGDSCNQESHTCQCEPLPCDGTRCSDGCGGSCPCSDDKRCFANGTCGYPCALPAGPFDCDTLGCGQCYQASSGPGSACGYVSGLIECDHNDLDCPVGSICAGALCVVAC